MRSVADRYGRSGEQCQEVCEVVHEPIFRINVTLNVTPLGEPNSPPKGDVGDHPRRMSPWTCR